MAVQITLTQGATVVATRAVSGLTGSFAEYSLDLTAAEVARITDPLSLVLTVISGEPGEALAFARVEVAGTTLQASPRITEDGQAYRITEDGTVFRITAGDGEPVIVDTTAARQAAFFAVF